MKKIYSLLFLAIAGTSFGQLTDSFTGTGSLNANGWTTHSGATPGQLSITAGSLNYTGLSSAGNKVSLIAGNSEDVNRGIGTPLTGIIYYSTAINVVNTTGLSTSGDYSMALSANIGATGVTTFFGRLYLKSGVTANTFNIGVWNASNATGGTGTAVYATTDYPVGTSLFVVIKYDRTTNIASMFINPALNSTEPAVATLTNSSGTTVAPTDVKGIAIREAGTAAVGTGNVDYDDVRVADNWSFVTTGILKVNQNSISGLNIYPNPVTNGKLFINTTANAEKSITVYDILGKQVVNVTTASSEVNVSSLNAGVYIVKVTEEGKTATRKLVIQ